MSPTLAGRRAPRASLPRRTVCVWLGLSLLGASGKTRETSSYIDRALLLIGEANRANEYLAKRLNDRELARVVARAAEGRLLAAKETIVPEEADFAHPHLLLMLEHCERAAAAAAAGEKNRYDEHTSAAHDEEELFRSVLRELAGPSPGKR
ncbi:MAG TPA: hypothetical protein VMG12_32540 [Polyangiaceae bacterium]|nr:hypothetical protein [Polyangiaceae bacterium]